MFKKIQKFQQLFFFLLFIAQVHNAHTADCMFLTDLGHAVNSRPHIPHTNTNSFTPAIPIVNTSVTAVDLNTTTILNSAVVLVAAPHLLSNIGQADIINPASMSVPVSIPDQTTIIPDRNIFENTIHAVTKRRVQRISNQQKVVSISVAVANAVVRIAEMRAKESAQHDTDYFSMSNTLNPNEQSVPFRCIPYNQLKPIYRRTILTTPLTIVIQPSVNFSVFMAGAGIPVVVIGGIGAAPVIAIPTAIVSVGLAIKWIVGAFKNKINSTKNTKEQDNGGNGGGGGGGGGDDGNNPNDPDNKNNKEDKNKVGPIKHPNGDYENNPKHHQNSKGDIGKPPRDGQKALDESIEVPGKERARVAIEDKHFVMLKQHSPGKWHGYIVESFKKLPQKAQNVLSKSGICNPKSGKIIK